MNQYQQILKSCQIQQLEFTVYLDRNKLLLKQMDEVMDEVDNVLNFCNQFLMLKMLSPIKADQHSKNNFSFQNQLSVKKKGKKYQRFENPTKKLNNDFKDQKQKEQQRVKLKLKKKKFQVATKTKAVNNSDEQLYTPTNIAKQQNGYVPIEALLQMGNKTNRSNYNNNFDSFGNSQFHMNKNKINTNTPLFNLNHNNSSYQYRQDFSRNTIMSNQLHRYSGVFNNYSPLNRDYERSQFYYESPVRYIHENSTNNLYVPASRTRSPLGNSKSCTNLSLSPQNKIQNDSSLSKRKKRNDKSFYLPTNQIGSKHQNIQNNSRIISTNNIISRLQRQAVEHLNEQMKNDKIGNEKSRVSQTRFETKTNRKEMQLKQIDDCSIIELDSGIREPLSYLSQARGPPRPILIQMKK